MNRLSLSHGLTFQVKFDIDGYCAAASGIENWAGQPTTPWQQGLRRSCIMTGQMSNRIILAVLVLVMTLWTSLYERPRTNRFLSTYCNEIYSCMVL